MRWCTKHYDYDDCQQPVPLRDRPKTDTCLCGGKGGPGNMSLDYVCCAEARIFTGFCVCMHQVCCPVHGHQHIGTHD